MSESEIVVRDVPPETMALSTLTHTYLKAPDLQGRAHTLAIERVALFDAPSTKGGGRETKPLVFFKGAKRPWVVNTTNALCLVAMFGDRFADWIGKRVTIQSEAVDAFGKVEQAIRVKGSPDIANTIRVQLPAGRKTSKRDLLKTAAPAATTESAEPTTTEG